MQDIQPLVRTDAHKPSAVLISRSTLHYWAERMHLSKVHRLIKFFSPNCLVIHWTENQYFDFNLVIVSFTLWFLVITLIYLGMPSDLNDLFTVD